MMINTDLYVRDVPGQLVSSLEPISAADGNIVGVVHNREQLVSGRISVNVTFDVDPARLEALKREWGERDVIVAKMGSVTETYPMDYMLIGDLSASYIEGLFDEASQRIGLRSVDVEYSSRNGDGGKRTAMVSVKVGREEELAELDAFLSAACREAGLVYVRGLDR